MDYIFIDTLGDKSLTGLVKDGELEYISIDEEVKSNHNNIYRARVEDVIPGMNAAFVDIGDKKNAYLSCKNALELEDLYIKSKKNITDILKSGDEILVQVKKEAFGDKGASVTKHIEIPGKYIIFTPYSNKVNVSRKIKKISKREKLQKFGYEIMKDNQGMIIRTICEDVDFSEIVNEYNRLKLLYEYIESQKNFLPIPKLIYKDLSSGEELIRDSLEKVEKIIVNDDKKFKDLLEVFDNLNLDIRDKLSFDLEYSNEYDLNVVKGMKKALARKINLKSGASIIIDRTEALTVIDVNTSSFVGNLSLDKTIYKTNIEAAREIAKQIKIRNLSGIILIDFINMKNKLDEKKVIDELKIILNKDSIRSNVIGMTELGLLEITRKRTSNSLDEILMSKCDNCNGLGMIKKE